MKAERWDEKHWNDTDHARTGRGRDTVMLMLNHAQNHLWREVWPAAPRDGARGKYWRDVRVQVHAIHHGGGGGMQAAADAAAAHVETVALAEGRTGTRVERQMAETRRGVLGSLRAATATPCTKEHLSQTGEYSLQDVSLSDPFEVNVALVMNAYCCFARCTGCRPGMAVNSRFDDLDPDARWFELPPLWNGSVSISPDEMCLEVEGLGKFLSMEVKFNRKKGEYYACYDFGTGITPDSDEMVRMGTLAMVRLLLATGAFRACVTKSWMRRIRRRRRCCAMKSRTLMALRASTGGARDLAAYLSLWRRADVMVGSWMRLQWIGLSSRRSTRQVSSYSTRPLPVGSFARS